MASPWIIGMEGEDGTVKSIVVWADGDLANGGRILSEHYRGTVKTARLLDLGDLSILGPELGEQHTREEHYQGGWRDVNGKFTYVEEPPYSGRGQGWCFAYIRDWGRPVADNAPETHASRAEFLDYARHADYFQAYLLTDKGWLYWPGDKLTPRKRRITAKNMPEGRPLDAALASDRLEYGY